MIEIIVLYKRIVRHFGQRNKTFVVKVKLLTWHPTGRTEDKHKITSVQVISTVTEIWTVYLSNKVGIYLLKVYV